VEPAWSAGSEAKDSQGEEKQTGRGQSEGSDEEGSGRSNSPLVLTRSQRKKLYTAEKILKVLKVLF